MSENNQMTQETAHHKKNHDSSGGLTLILDVFFRTLHYWPWLVLSIAVCMGAALSYVLRTPDVYTQDAALLLKEEGRGKSTNGNYDQWGEFGLFQNNINVQNEIKSLKSPDLMEEVVKRLKLQMSYYLPGAFHKVVAYGTNLPLTVAIPDLADSRAASFDLDLSTDGKFQISHLKINNESVGQTYTGNLNDTINTVMGPLVVAPGPDYQKGKKVELKVNRLPLNTAIQLYESHMSVALSSSQSSVIVVTLTDQNIQRANEVLATVIGVYNENWIRDRNQIAVSTSNFINERLAVIESELGSVDSDISSYKSHNLVHDFEAAGSSYFQETQQLNQEMMDLNNQLQMTRYVRNYLSNEMDDKPLPTNTGMQNLNIQSQISEYNTKLLERNNLLTKTSDKNPLIQNMDKDLEELRGAIIGSVDNYVVNLQTQMGSLQSARGASTSKLAANPTQAKYLLSVERQQKVKESLYLFLLQKREDNELSQAFTAYNTRVLKKPGPSGVPPMPNKKQILIVAGVLGLVLPFGGVYVSQMLNTRVRGRKDVEGLSLPMLGEIPQHGKPTPPTPRSSKKKKKEKTKNELIVKPGSRNIINEAFRVLRTNIEFTRLNKETSNVLAITSFNPGSGKSFITMNLAASLALKKRRVVVIDGDMRHASVSAYVDRPEEGLAEYLAGDIKDIHSVEKQIDDFPTLSIIPVGSIPPNPTELLEGKRFGELIEELRQEYDYVLIDCPPIEVVADAHIIDQVADRTIFIIRAGLLERSMLNNLETLYETKKFNHIAFILNGTQVEAGTFGYRHSYKYGYGYGYGYGYAYDNEKK